MPSVPTLFIVHPKEKRSKCSIEPLRGTDGFEFYTWPKTPPQPLNNYVRLGLGGELLSPADAENGLLILDGTWRYAEQMEADYLDLPVRSLSGWETAYPRTSKLFEDPQSGLATIEAVYAAYMEMGHSVDGLLESYYWSDKFQELNAQTISRCINR